MSDKSILITGSILVGITVLCGIVVLILQIRANIKTKYLKNNEVSDNRKDEIVHSVKSMELASSIISTAGVITALFAIIFNFAMKNQKETTDAILYYLSLIR